jgi:arsenate reductase
MKKRILVLCTGNSCRSQIAEGYLRHFAGEQFEVSSAGLEPGVVNPRAIQVMKEDGVNISAHTSDDVNQYIGQNFDYIITVCDNARERCPYFPSEAERIHWSFKDPADAVGNKEEVLDEFRKVRDLIKSTLKQFISELNS